jgi:hypothetical protein
MPRGPRWRLWLIVNALHERVRWRWVQWLWAKLIAPEWIGDGGSRRGAEEPF